MENLLAGKTALVTGASRGLGRGIAQRLAASGAVVCINYAGNHEAANETLATIEAAGGNAFLLQQPLGPDGSAEALTASLTTEFVRRTGSAGLDILVNNVGGGDYGDITSITGAAFDKVISDNVRAPFFITQALLPHLREGGRIINISSAASRLALRETIVYCMSKAALDMFTLVMAKELGARKITVNSVLPGFNATESNAREFNDPATRKAIEDMTTLGRFGQPEDIADVVHALTTPAMGWVTGQCIEASGGFKL